MIQILSYRSFPFHGLCVHLSKFAVGNGNGKSIQAGLYASFERSEVLLMHERWMHDSATVRLMFYMYSTECIYKISASVEPGN